MPVSNPRIQLDETWSIKVADDSDDYTRLFTLVEQGVKNIGEDSVDSEFLYETSRQFFSGPLSEKVFLVLYKDLYPVGVLLGAKVDAHPVFRKTGITIEQLWWVDPSYRGSKTATKLVDAFVEWSRQLGVKRVVMGHFNDPIGEKLQKHYEHIGFKLLEQSYVKELV
jgi:GNAT superfamily N-acetyltransferase